MNLTEFSWCQMMTRLKIWRNFSAGVMDFPAGLNPGDAGNKSDAGMFLLYNMSLLS